MATLPRSTTSVSATAGALGAGTDLCCVWSPVATNADTTPRQFGSAAAIFEQHGYCEGVEYAALHFEQTRKPLLFVGLPIVTLGVVGRLDTSGNSGTSVVSITAGGTGVLGEHAGVLTVIAGGTIGADQIVLGVSLDGGRTTKRVRLGTGNSYAIPYVNVTASFAAGALVAGDTIATWHGSAPLADADGVQAARLALAAQQKLCRSMLLIGDLPDSDAADAYLTQLNAYATANERFVYGRASVYDREPQAELSHVVARMTGSPSITFTEVDTEGDTITRSAGSFIADGFAVGDTITVTGAVASAGANNISGVIASLSATVITLGAEDLVDEGPITGVSIVARPTLTFAEVGGTGDTLTRNRGSWLDDGFRVGDTVTVDGSASNDVSGAVTGVTATALTFGSTDLAAEVVSTEDVTVTAGQTKAAWLAEIDAEFASVDDAFRIDLSAGRGRVLSPFSGWRFRRPAAWAASIREYQHDLHVATWRKSDGVTGFDLYDAEGNLAEWDDRVDGEAGVGARFTCFRSFANGPDGAFIALSLTRAEEGSPLSLTHNVAVTNLACTVVQAATEDVIGRSLILNDDGTATSDSLTTIESEVNAKLELALLQNRGEGPRASKAVWRANRDDDLSQPDALLTGVLELDLNGTIHSVDTETRVNGGS